MYDNRLSAAPSRDIPADILKCVCCICVIIIHTASLSITTLDVHSFDWYCGLFWGTVSRYAVPIFFMVTGALLLDPEKKLSLKKIYKNYFLRMLLCLFFWSLMYEFYYYLAYWILYGTYYPTWFIDSITDVFTFDHHFHLYYLQILLVFYAILPVMRVFVAGADRRLLRYALILWFILGVCFPFLACFEPFASVGGIPGQYPLQMVYSSMGYGLLGYYIKSAKLERKWLRYFILCFNGGFLCIYIPEVIIAHMNGKWFQPLLESFTPPATALCIGIYGAVTILFRDKTAEQCPRIVAFSKASFSVYLTHHFFVMALRKLIKHSYTDFPLLNIPAQTVLILFACFITYFILKRIPGVRRYLI